MVLSSILVPYWRTPATQFSTPFLGVKTGKRDPGNRMNHRKGKKVFFSVFSVVKERGFGSGGYPIYQELTSLSGVDQIRSVF
jgi:hypothetical protein